MHLGRAPKPTHHGQRKPQPHQSLDLLPPIYNPWVEVKAVNNPCMDLVFMIYLVGRSWARTKNDAYLSTRPLPIWREGSQRLWSIVDVPAHQWGLCTASFQQDSVRASECKTRLEGTGGVAKQVPAPTRAGRLQDAGKRAISSAVFALPLDTMCRPWMATWMPSSPRASWCPTCCVCSCTSSRGRRRRKGKPAAHRPPWHCVRR